MSRLPHLAARADLNRRAHGNENVQNRRNDSAVRDAFLGIGIRLGIVLGLAYGIQTVIPWIAG
ncbi:hypothetical protein LAC81_15880 [Ensifer adhaerens]|uniref:hypothetical protein n=1 Tax=Ensifer adhaerens TaxID=106592 RepID=UPI001CBD5A33|nr:hypothetical protein [Ensifer adhaerens]MBZ7923270.1 hypothetical protein [Ensifer adhaerens]UAX91847.1 hypothetical protein LAC78_15875 [Ensifer adhaerens]UAX99475.1 hypothetical protein LAC80_15880 [Ensifer adhaerens]UAY06858.1 hypothetical protein LAC81_15880 [Ensifer adhaerens]